jgi:hypothetical protein
VEGGENYLFKKMGFLDSSHNNSSMEQIRELIQEKLNRKVWILFD